MNCSHATSFFRPSRSSLQPLPPPPPTSLLQSSMTQTLTGVPQCGIISLSHPIYPSLPAPLVLVAPRLPHPHLLLTPHRLTLRASFPTNTRMTQKTSLTRSA